MKILIVTLASVSMLACRPAPLTVEAPVVVRVGQVPYESLTDEPPYIPTIRWIIKPIMPEEIEDDVVGTRFEGGAVYHWGGINAVLSLDGDKMRLDCSTGGTGIFTCMSDEGSMSATCERMSFKLVCTKR